jgi:hypothetical protein
MATGNLSGDRHQGVKTMSQIIGGWGEFNYDVSAEAKAVLTEALGGLVGVKYVPLAVATQVVAGTNYCFLCTGTSTSLPSPSFPALLYVYKPLSGEAHLTALNPIRP